METFVKPNIRTGATTLDARWYTSPDILARAGDFFTVERAAESLIVVRDNDDQVHALYNVCRHRGTRICELASGHFQGSIQCPYHGWTYGLDGGLKVARNMAEVPNFDRAEYPLKEAAVALWEGFIMANLASPFDSAQGDTWSIAFERAFAPLIGRFARWNIHELRTARSITYGLACNWKLIFLNYSECYHCPLVHPQLDKLSPSDSGRNVLSEGPFLGGYSDLRQPGTSLTMSGHSSRPPIGSVAGDDLNRVYYYTLFPSFMLSTHPDYVMVHYVKPIAPNRTELVCAWLFDPRTIAQPDFDPSDVVDFWDLTNGQDWHVSELTQLGLGSRAYSPGPYSKAEGLLHAFDRHYLSVMES